LIATSRPSRVSRPRCTSAMPPKPRSSATWYLPPRRRACAVISSRVLRSSSLTLPQYFPPAGTGGP
jgi:hypothetical protein